MVIDCHDRAVPEWTAKSGRNETFFSFYDDKISHVLNPASVPKPPSPPLSALFPTPAPSPISPRPNTTRPATTLKLALPRTVSRNFRDEALNVYPLSADIFFAKPFMERTVERTLNVPFKSRREELPARRGEV